MNDNCKNMEYYRYIFVYDLYSEMPFQIKVKGHERKTLSLINIHIILKEILFTKCFFHQNIL